MGRKFISLIEINTSKPCKAGELVNYLEHALKIDLDTETYGNNFNVQSVDIIWDQKIDRSK